MAVSLAAHGEIGAVRRIERYTREPLPVNVVAGFEPRRSPPKGGAGGGGKRPGQGRGGPRHGQGSGGGRWSNSNSAPRYGNNSGNAGSGGYQGGQRFGGAKPAGAPYERRESSGYQGGYQQSEGGNGGHSGNGFSTGSATDRFERRSPRPADGNRQDRGARSFDAPRQDRGFGNRNGGGFNKRRSG